MDTRVTTRQGLEFSAFQLARQSAELQKVQRDLATGVRLHRPSDDPAAVRRSIVQKDKLSRLETHIESVQQVKSRVSQAHVQLREAQQLLVQARSVALSASQANSDAEVNAYAAEVDGILNQLISLANSADESGYLFAGTATRSEPFSIDKTTGAVVYSGTSANSALHLTGDVPRDALVSGDQVFQSIIRESTLVLGSTGVSAGTGTDTALGTRTLTVSHTSTVYSGGSGVAAGTSSVGGDTIVGNTGTHQLQINDTSGTGASGTVSLNGGAEVAFTSADTDLLVRGPAGEEVYLDLSSITGGFNGTVDIVANGTLSIDGGTTTQAITFDANEVLTDPVDGSVIHLNTEDIQFTGTDSIEFPGTNNAFQILTSLRDDLRNTRDLSNADRIEAFDRRIADIERIENHFLDEIGVQGVALQQMERLQVRTEDQTLEQQVKYGETTGADLAKATIRMQELLTLQQFTLASVSKLFSQNLLQYLQ